MKKWLILAVKIPLLILLALIILTVVCIGAVCLGVAVMFCYQGDFGPAFGLLVVASMVGWLIYDDLKGNL